MKLNGLFGMASGKLGSSVFAITNGEQVVRQYQPVVSNPSTTAQVAQRSKFKLISQLAAEVAPVIAIPREGNVSPRNLFIKKNIQYVTESNGTASVEISKLQLTSGTRYIGPIKEFINSRSGVSVDLGGTFVEAPTAIIVALFSVNSDNTLSFVEAKTATGDFVEFGSMQLPQMAAAVYAYYVEDEQALAKYGDYQITSASQLATLLSSRSARQIDGVVTKTAWAFASLA